MVYFDLIFRSRLIKEVVENEGELWTEGSISWLSINRGYYQVNMVQVIDSSILPRPVVLSVVALQSSG